MRPAAMPSRVSIRLPCASIASTVQLYITLPSMMTVQAPQVPRSHTRLAAVRSRRCRKVSNNVLRGSTLVLYGLPLICSVMGTSPGPATLALVCASASCSRIPLGGNLIDLSKRLNQQVLWLQSEPYTGNQQRQNNQRDYGISPIPLEREA